MVIEIIKICTKDLEGIVEIGFFKLLIIYNMYLDEHETCLFLLVVHFTALLAFRLRARQTDRQTDCLVE